jgi:hypothetical protein
MRNVPCASAERVPKRDVININQVHLSSRLRTGQFCEREMRVKREASLGLLGTAIFEVTGAPSLSKRPIHTAIRRHPLLVFHNPRFRGSFRSKAAHLRLVKGSPAHSIPTGLVRRGVSLSFADDLAHSVLGFADAAADVTLSFIGLAFAFKMAVAESFTGFLLYRAGTFLNAAFDPLPVHWPAPSLAMLCQRNAGGACSGPG